MKKFFLPILISTILLSACSTQESLYSNQEQDFNIDEYSENFELEFEDINTNKIEVEQPKENEAKQFLKFEDENIGFSFLYPDNNKIIKDMISSPVRIQNYPLEQNSLNIGDFYIEIFYLDNNLNCEYEIGEITSTYENKGITINRGLGKQEGDTGGTKYAICFKKGGKLIYVSYTENGNLNVNNIFNSLQIH